MSTTAPITVNKMLDQMIRNHDFPCTVTVSTKMTDSREQIKILKGILVTEICQNCVSITCSTQIYVENSNCVGTNFDLHFEKKLLLPRVDFLSIKFQRYKKY